MPKSFRREVQKGTHYTILFIIYILYKLDFLIRQLLSTINIFRQFYVTKDCEKDTSKGL